MIPTIASSDRNGSLLARYVARMGALVDRRLSQIALEGARKEAESAAQNAMAASRAKTEFLANMSHELHTPLSSIIGFAEMMEREVRGPVPVSYREYAKNIVDSGRQLVGIVSDVLDMSQIENGKYELAETEIDVGETLTGIFRLVQGRAAQAGLFLQARLPKDLPRLKADAKAFKQIVINLLSNAIKFTNAGGRIFVLPATTPEGDLSLRVIDTGIGIKQSDLARILQPFERIGAAQSRAKPGAGLGLSLVTALVGLHGGTFQIQSKVGVGTIATVIFPQWRLAPGAAAAPDDAGAPAPSADTARPPPAPSRTAHERRD
ncbi:MAG TPA: HAMP domain-containing sensor histidine kinase [Alphaproteobacteria bacterium]|jgi:signal transduction histidine kinase